MCMDSSPCFVLDARRVESVWIEMGGRRAREESVIEADKVRKFRIGYVESRESSVLLDFQMLGRENEKPCDVEQA